MALESGTYISDLVSTNPVGATDPKSQGDDHLRLIKATVKATFPNITGALTSTQVELNYVTGVTSAIQTQLNAKASVASVALKADDNAVVKLAGNETITGIKTFNAFHWATAAGSSGDNASRALMGFSDDRTDRYSAIGTYRGAASARIGLSFWGSYDALPVERVRIDDSGNLRVLAGDLYFSGTLQAGTVPWARLSGVPTTLSGTVNLTGNQTVAGVKTLASPVINTSLDLGHATDTTLTRLAAAKVGVEGKALIKHTGSYVSGEVTVSTAAPTGGTDGDIWLRY